LSSEGKSKGVMDGESGEEKDGLRYAQRDETGSVQTLKMEWLPVEP